MSYLLRLNWKFGASDIAYADARIDAGAYADGITIDLDRVLLDASDAPVRALAIDIQPLYVGIRSAPIVTIDNVELILAARRQMNLTGQKKLFIPYYSDVAFDIKLYSVAVFEQADQVYHALVNAAAQVAPDDLATRQIFNAEIYARGGQWVWKGATGAAPFDNEQDVRLPIRLRKENAGRINNFRFYGGEDINFPLFWGDGPTNCAAPLQPFGTGLMIGALAAWGCSLPNQDLPLPGTPFSNLARGNPAFFPQRCGLHEGGAIISAEFQRRQPIDIHLDATNDYAGSGKETLRRLDAGMIPKCEIWIACLPQIATNATTYGVTFGAMIN